MCRDNSYYARQADHIIRWDLKGWEDRSENDWYGTYHNIAGASQWPVIVHDSVQQANDSIIAHWGLIPWWTKDKAEGIKKCNSMVNARVETVHQSNAYKGLIYTSRCILPSTGFYEHHHIYRKGPKGGVKDISVPFYIRPKDQPIFGLAAFFTTWTDKATGEMIPSFTVLTTKANELMAKIHNGGDFSERMPVMLEPDMEAAWINKGTGKNVIDEIMHYRIPADKLEAWPIRSVRKRDRPDDPTLLTRQQVAEIDWA